MKRKHEVAIYENKRARGRHKGNSYTRATKLFLTEVQLDKFSTSRGPIKFLIYNDKNETFIISKYKKILGFSLSLHTLH